MATTEKFCLRWNDFESNISGAFRELREDKDFFDVTLACDDDQIQAHKVILSACSPFFRSILRRNRHEHPLLYLKGVKYADLVSVLNFMYHGEVNVAQEELNTFLAVAEDLKIKGLTQNNPENKQSKREILKPNVREFLKQPSPPTRPRPPPQVTKTHTVSPTVYQHIQDDIQEVVPVKSEPVSVPVEPAVHTFSAAQEQPYSSGRSQEAHEGIVADPSMEDYGEEYGEGYGDYAENYEGTGLYEGAVGNTGEETKVLEDLVLSSMSAGHCDVRGAMWSCNHCGKEDKDKNNMRRHVESHFNFKHNCAYCDKVFKSRPSMQSHVSRKHKDGV